MCTSGGAHPVRKLLLTQIAAGGALITAATRAHAARAAWALPACPCGTVPTPSSQDKATAKKLLQQALQKVSHNDIEEKFQLAKFQLATLE